MELIIVLDHPWALYPLEVRWGSSGELCMLRTILGWTAQGAMIPEGTQETANSLTAIVELSEAPGGEVALEEQVRRFWELDEPTGAEVQEEEGLSALDQYVMNLWSSRVHRSGNHYVLPIPFKQPSSLQVNHWTSAKKNLESLTRRLKKDGKLGTAYRAEIYKLLELGQAERVPDRELRRQGSRIWYLPHQPVVSPSKPGKVRIVFNCAATHHGVSLNSQVLQGPDLNNKLLGILLRFHEGKVAVTADIEAMCYQVQVAEKDRDALHFLWKDDDQDTPPVEVFRMKVHVFGGVWSPACAAYALRRTFKEYGEEYGAAVMKTAKNFYVDDLLHSVDSEQQVAVIAEQTTCLMEKDGFHLTK